MLQVLVTRILPLKPVTIFVFGSVSQQQQTLKHLSKNIQRLFLFLTHNSQSLSQPRIKQEEKTAVLNTSSVDLINLVFVIENFHNFAGKVLFLLIVARNQE